MVYRSRRAVKGYGPNRYGGYHEDDTPRAKHLYDRTFSEGMEVGTLNTKRSKRNGELLYVSNSWEPLRIDGQVTEILERGCDGFIQKRKIS
jgi:hypothetical protein